MTAPQRPWRRMLVAASIAAALMATAPTALHAHLVRGGTASSCSITPNQVVLDQTWTVNAVGLPTSNVNMIITFPDGAQSTGPITVAGNGTYTTTGNSNMSATWGFIAPEQTGTYTYQFVGRIKWPAGTFSQRYAQCSVVVS